MQDGRERRMGNRGGVLEAAVFRLGEGNTPPLDTRPRLREGRLFAGMTERCGGRDNPFTLSSAGVLTGAYRRAHAILTSMLVSAPPKD